MKNSLNLSLSKQLVVVVTPSWSSIVGQLFRFKKRVSDWKQVGRVIPVTVGEKGMAWGRGLHKDELENLRKKEGDGKSPSGIFSLGPVFGDPSHRCNAKSMPYLLVEEDLECVDDPLSKHYNCFVRSSHERDWTSSEKMKEIDLYAIGVVVGHNTSPVKPYAGSCIFLHIWRDASHGTAGCTAMKEEDLQELVLWLDQDKAPFLVQLPIQEYRKRQVSWELPLLF